MNNSYLFENFVWFIFIALLRKFDILNVTYNLEQPSFYFDLLTFIQTVFDRHSISFSPMRSSLSLFPVKMAALEKDNSESLILVFILSTL